MNKPWDDNQQLHDLLAAVRASQHRLLVHFQGSSDWAKVLIEEWFGREKPLYLDSLPPRRVRQLLGTEQQTLVVDAWKGFNPNMLGIASPTIKAGGFLIVITPPLASWPQYFDPDYARMLVDGEPLSTISGRFVRFTGAILDNDPKVLRVIEDGAQTQLPEHSWPKRSSDARFFDQRTAIDAIARVATGHGRRPLVLTADRGRGKTAALGFACAELMQGENARQLLVTAPVYDAVACLFRHCAESLGIVFEAQRHLTFGHSELVFMPVDQILSERPLASLLIVDEAAAIPTAHLNALSDIYNRLVFASTVHGYEGNGRGFALRFQDQLLLSYPQTRQMELTQPIRFAENDPVEAIVNRILLLAGAASEAASESAVTGLSQVDRDQLVDRPDELAAIFNLLLEAHYQTSPDDLRIMLDHPDVSIWVYRQQNPMGGGSEVSGVVLLMREGRFDTSDCDLLSRSQRRFRGHLLPQSIASIGFSEALPATFFRVMRIAVSAEYRRQKIASTMLTMIETQLTQDRDSSPSSARSGVFIGASFSCDRSLLGFWQACGYQPVRLGVSRESASGQYAAVVIKSLDDVAFEMQKRWRKAFHHNLGYQLLTSHRSLDAAMIPLLYQQSPMDLESLDTDVVHQLNAYVAARCSFEVAAPCLQRALVFWLSCADCVGNCPEGLIESVALLLQGQSWHSVAKNFDHSGRKAVETKVRRFIAGIDESIADNILQR
ncbi:tRNA(Met) cytidine acetyltransferase TmcA [BD1-7 clade bacterium]|uniref:tRNA(Met) cytidine acetyltransferase TmcA n=1 Tax=BD1-7 clade bacterium TaxID=2029982 RepID=A0A5S9NTM1_9GAMM|nr:tRNA(Met) cytidine acetyltransferase TmcA [BD1-7 clade bacterium]CAA0094019.1 tRNA(Met) cytidine acetyltransferase TmcA [BD1-7 clade bacterium]